MTNSRTYKTPKSLDEFSRGTVYQVWDLMDEAWSSDRVITSLCYSTKTLLQLLINREGIRIIKEE
jgi:hypothetical protein